ncbi:MAG: AMP-binding protein [Phormidesmis sp.]
MAAIGMTPEAVWGGLRQDWCVGLGNGKREVESQYWRESREGGEAWFELVVSRREQLETYASKQDGGSAAGLIVLVADAEPMEFLAGFWAGILAGWTVALGNPNWATSDWQSTYQLINPNIIWGNSPPSPVTERSRSPIPLSPSILIPTSGTSGQPKFTRHTWTTLTAAVSGFCRHFQPDNTPVNTYCVLPLYHVSGLMQALRTWLTNGQISILPFKNLLSPPYPFPLLPPHTYLSLVPTQLSRLLTARKAPWLKQFHAILLGGAPPWPALLDQAARHQIPICLSYGMTETGAMVAAMRSQDFSQGHRSRNLSSGRPMPHAKIQIEDRGKRLPSGKIGQIVVTSSAIAHGYYNAPSPSFEGRAFYTDDLGYLDDLGQLHVTGRASDKIISGGENIFPTEVEAALRSSSQVLNVCVVGLPDADWGEVVAAAYIPAYRVVSADSLRAALDEGGQLSRYKYPKRWFPLENLPENAQGKVNRLALRALLDQLSSQSGGYQ